MPSHRALPALALGLLILVGALVGRVPPAFAQATDLDTQTRAVAAELRCPVCENLSVADSPSPLAGEMRAMIRQKLTAGESRDSIVRYFTDRYGEGILLNPPRQGFSLLAWGGGAAAVLIGGLMLIVKVRRALARSTPAGASAVPPVVAGGVGNDDPYEARLDLALAQYKGEPPC